MKRRLEDQKSEFSPESKKAKKKKEEENCFMCKKPYSFATIYEYPESRTPICDKCNYTYRKIYLGKCDLCQKSKPYSTSRRSHCDEKFIGTCTLQGNHGNILCDDCDRLCHTCAICGEESVETDGIGGNCQYYLAKICRMNPDFKQKLLTMMFYSNMIDKKDIKNYE